MPDTRRKAAISHFCAAARFVVQEAEITLLLCKAPTGGEGQGEGVPDADRAEHRERVRPKC